MNRLHPLQAPPTAVNGSMLAPMYSNPPQTHEMIYQQPHHYQAPEIAEVPIMEPSPAEVSNHS